MRNVSQKIVEKIKTHIVFSKMLFFTKIILFMRQCRNICRVGQATDESIAHAHCMLDT
jgi:hypothetical protein